MAKKKIGIKDIAEKSGVAPSTVSHVMNGTASISEEVRERVLRVARDTGYLSRRRSQANIASLRKVLLAIPPDALPDNDVNLVSWTILNSLTQEADARSIRVSVHKISPNATFAQVSDAAKVGEMDGIIVLNDDRPNLLKAICKSGLPAVLINGEDPDMYVDSVTPGNRFAAQKATKRLIDLGHKRIMHLTWQGRKTVLRRLDGFKDAFTESPLSSGNAVTVFAKGYEPRHAEEAIRNWLATHPDLDGVTAIFCAADNLAFGAMKALRAAGVRMPQDMSLMGFDGVGLGELHVPSLSTVQIPLEEMGRAALELLEQRANTTKPGRAARRLELGCEIIERDSLAPPRAKSKILESTLAIDMPGAN